LPHRSIQLWNPFQEQQQTDLEEEEPGDEIDDEAEGAVDDELFFQESVGAEPEVSLDNSAHHMLTSHIDPVAWKTELERVGPRLRAQQQLASNEWRAHVDQTVSSKSQIEQLLSIAQGDLKSLNRFHISAVSDSFPS
jgi:estrogen-related receptor beta like 1